MIATPTSTHQRLHLHIQGMVQGVGFRPFVYGLATALELGGWVRNTKQGVEIEIEGTATAVAQFIQQLQQEPPPHAVLAQLESQYLPPQGTEHFEIQPSPAQASSSSAWILPDLATCPDCLTELFDPRDRRYYYPFINCTHCGPRYSIITALPYDRHHTTMRVFSLCPTCQQEYDDPANRRFHAQPNACPDCGPQVELWDASGQILVAGDTVQVLQQTADRIRQGQIVALKGLGGFHLLVDARSEMAVQRLRDRKNRPTQPLAVLYPHLAALQQDCWVSPTATELLTSAAAPIVLLRPKPENTLAPSIAPHQATVGVMLPYTPLHHLLMAELDFPIVATSGNRSQAPICIDNTEAVHQLGSIADIFVVHNRPIARPVDDSVMHLVNHHPMALRRARGYAPLPITYAGLATGPCVLAVGGHQKNTVALSLPGQLVVSQHLGDLNQVPTMERFQATITELLHLYDAQPVAIASDLHPDYTSTHQAQHLSQQMAIPLIQIQHHYAHLLASMVDNQITPPVLGFAWDGLGYGINGELWGGECLAIPNNQGFEQVAQLRSFPLPGGEQAAREPCRAALGLLYAAFGDRAFSLKLPILQALPRQTVKLLQTMLNQGINSPQTSSIGRLFDAIAAILGLCQRSSFEGEAAMQLEAATTGTNTTARYPFDLVRTGTGPLQLDWEPMLSEILADRHDSVGVASAKFHNTLIAVIVEISKQVNYKQIVLTGGCFQNRYLLEGAIQNLSNSDFRPYHSRHIPPNDGGLAIGQLLGATWKLDRFMTRFY